MNLTKKLVLESLSGIANLVALMALLAHIFNPSLAHAQAVEELTTAELLAIETTLAETPESHLFYPDVVVHAPDRRLKATITAYTSTPDQTDDTPFIAASGKRVHDGMIAANGLPFGTIVKIPRLYGNKEFVVWDRMNARYGYGHMDIWLDASKAEARKFGRKHIEVEIYYPKKQLAKR